MLEALSVTKASGSPLDLARSGVRFGKKHVINCRDTSPPKKPRNPIGSVYAIFTYLWLNFYGFHVGKYTIHGWYGKETKTNNYSIPPEIIAAKSLRKSMVGRWNVLLGLGIFSGFLWEDGKFVGGIAPKKGDSSGVSTKNLWAIKICICDLFWEEWNADLLS